MNLQWDTWSALRGMSDQNGNFVVGFDAHKDVKDDAASPADRWFTVYEVLDSE